MNNALSIIKRVAITCFGLITLCVGGSVYANSTTSTFQVTANVPGSCTVNANPMAFGAYAGAQLTSNTTITVTCTIGTEVEVGLSAGESNDVKNRMMSDGKGNTLPYNLYQDAKFGTLWTDIGGGGTVSFKSKGEDSINVYGVILANQNSPTGNYNDTITATVQFAQ